MLRIIDLPVKLPLLAGETEAVVGPMPTRRSSANNVQSQGRPGASIRSKRHTDTGLEAVAVCNRPVYQPLKLVVCGASLLIAVLAIALKALADNPCSTVVEALDNGGAAKNGAFSALSLS